MIKLLLLALSALLISSCALAPGMKINENALTHRVIDDAPPLEVTLYPITANTIAEQYRKGSGRLDPVQELPIDSAKYQYHIQAQDVLQITIWDHPELTIPEGQYRSAADTGTVVHSDGTIFYPYVGEVKVAGMTLKQVRELLTMRIADYVESPQLDVRVVAFRSQKVYVTGQVQKPGEVSLTDDAMHVLDAINAAGGAIALQNATVGNEADLENVTLVRDGKSYLIDLNQLLSGGNVIQNYLLQDGDILHVPDNLQNKVFVLGEVNSAAAQLIHKGRLTLAEALGSAGGVNMSSANASKIYVIRGNVKHADDAMATVSSAPSIYKLDASSPDALILADQFQLQARDVVFVSTSPVVAWGRTLSNLSTTIQAVNMGRALKLF
ncbi:MAG: polysaccharide biosynthesis/export family protein [Zetaproteobacteria bacterium]|nr:polysaccharide biosynthesis/export family protein [Zetaproteobacteria bacterium]